MTDLRDALAKARTTRAVDDLWSLRALLNESRKAGRLDETIEVGRQLVADFADFEPIRQVLGWALYDQALKNLTDDSPRDERRQAKAAVDEISELLESDPYSQYSPLPQAALKLARTLKPWPRHALAEYERLDPARLSREQWKDVPSPAARWYLGVTAALEDLNDWPRLVDACDRALADGSFPREHVRWVRRRLGLAYEGLGNWDMALPVLEEVDREIGEWWSAADLGRCQAAAGMAEQALTSCRRALAATGPLEPRWRTTALIAELLADDDGELAAEHLKLARMLRDSAGWPEEKDLEEAARAAGIMGDEKADMGRLRRWWQEAEEAIRMSGMVETVFDHGGAGFLRPRGSATETIYFSMPRGQSSPPEGTVVTFKIVDSFDQKKNRPSQRAVDVRPTT